MHSSTLRILIVSLTTLIATLPIQAQAPVAAPTAQEFKLRVAVGQKRADLLRDEIKQIDSRIESRLDVIVDTLDSISDTKNSGTKVARMKEDTMKRLGKTIQYYDQKRAALREDLRRPTTRLTEEEKRRIISVFDARIEKRAKQILALNKSMPTSKDYERYNSTGSNWDGPTYERNKDFEQNRKMTSHTNTQRDALVKQLDSSIARLERQSATLRTKLSTSTAQSTYSAEQLKSLNEEIAKNDALIAERRQQKLEVLKATSVDQRGVALKEAMDLDKAMKKAIEDLRRDFTTLFQRYNSFVAELSALHATEAALSTQTAAR